MEKKDLITSVKRLYDHLLKISIEWFDIQNDIRNQLECSKATFKKNARYKKNPRN